MLATAAIAAVIGTTCTAGAWAQTSEAPLEPEAIQPTTLVALIGDKRLVTINANTARVIKSVLAKGAGGAVVGRLIGIDVRPADGNLYGVDTAGVVYVINPDNGTATIRSLFAPTFSPNVRWSVDFNPAANRLRMIGNDGTNLRGDVDCGACMVTVDTPINYALPNPFGGVNPEVIAAAYSNNLPGPTPPLATLLWDIDNTTDALHLQLPPNNGTLNAVGNVLGITPGNVGFDIETRADGTNQAWLLNGRVLYRLGLVSGIAENPRPVSGLTGTVRDLAVLQN
jgi:hypothetical protein